MTKFDIKRMEKNVRKFFDNVTPNEATYGTVVCEDQAKLLHEYSKLKEKVKQLQDELYDCLCQGKTL